jgi:hypothetical protein
MYRGVSAIAVTAGTSGKGGAGVCGRRPELLSAEILSRSVRYVPQTTRHFGRDEKSRKGSGLQTGHYKG